MLGDSQDGGAKMDVDHQSHSLIGRSGLKTTLGWRSQDDLGLIRAIDLIVYPMVKHEPI